MNDHSYTLAVRLLDRDELTINLVLATPIGEVSLKEAKFDPNKEIMTRLGVDRTNSNGKLFEPISSTAISFDNLNDLIYYLVIHQAIILDLSHDLRDNGYHYDWVFIESNNDVPEEITSGWDMASDMIKDCESSINGFGLNSFHWYNLKNIINIQDMNKAEDEYRKSLENNEDQYSIMALFDTFKSIKDNLPNTIIKFDTHCGYLELPIKDLIFSSSFEHGEIRFILSERTK